jgi:hypothetical protein
MRSPPPSRYLDGCTFGPQKFGSVYHNDICTSHDLDWWYDRRATQKTVADWRWSAGIVKRHARNGFWIVPAALYASLGFLWLMTGGWLFWAGWVGHGKKLRDET